MCEAESLPKSPCFSCSAEGGPPLFRAVPNQPFPPRPCPQPGGPCLPEHRLGEEPSAAPPFSRAPAVPFSFPVLNPTELCSAQVAFSPRGFCSPALASRKLKENPDVTPWSRRRLQKTPYAEDDVMFHMQNVPRCVSPTPLRRFFKGTLSTLRALENILQNDFLMWAFSFCSSYYQTYQRLMTMRQQSDHT